MDHDETERSGADQLLAKIERFVADLDGDEKTMFAALIGPGVEALTIGREADDEVVGFGGDTHVWEPLALRDDLADALRRPEWDFVQRRSG